MNELVRFVRLKMCVRERAKRKEEEEFTCVGRSRQKAERVGEQSAMSHIVPSANRRRRRRRRSGRSSTLLRVFQKRKKKKKRKKERKKEKSK